MKKSLVRNTIFGSTFGLLALIAGNSIAQSQFQTPKMGMVFTTNAQECANACSNDMLCASWAFSSIKVGKSEATTGQCQFSNSANISAVPGAIIGLPSRNKTADLGYSSTIPANQMDAYKSAALKTGNGQIYQGNYGVKPLNYGPPAKIASNSPIALNVAPPQIIPPKNNNAMVSFEKPNNVEVYKAPVNIIPVKIETPKIEVPVAKTEIKPEVKKVVGPLHSGGFQKKELSAEEQKAFIGKDGMIDAAEMRRYELKYGSKKSGGQYSVQKEWNEVAEAMKNGDNVSDIDWSKTKPVVIAENSQKSSKQNDETEETPKAKKSLFGFLNRKLESEVTDIQMPAKGPLRKKTAQNEDPIY